MPRPFPSLAAALALAALAAPALAQSDGEVACPGRVTVAGSGEVRAVPDQLSARFDIRREAGDPGAALSAASEAVQAVLEALAAQGVPEADIATASVSLSPLRERPDRDSPPEITGWQAGSALQVTLDDPAAFGPAASAATEAGATGIGGVQLTLADPAPLRAEARDAAVKDALAKARAMARAAGLTPGAVLELREGAASDGGPERFAGARAMAVSADMPVATGEQLVTETVTAVVELCR